MFKTIKHPAIWLLLMAPLDPVDAQCTNFELWLNQPTLPTPDANGYHYVYATNTALTVPGPYTLPPTNVWPMWELNANHASCFGANTVVLRKANENGFAKNDYIKIDSLNNDPTVNESPPSLWVDFPSDP